MKKFTLILVASLTAFAVQSQSRYVIYPTSDYRDETSGFYFGGLLGVAFSKGINSVTKEPVKFQAKTIFFSMPIGWQSRTNYLAEVNLQVSKEPQAMISAGKQVGPIQLLAGVNNTWVFSKNEQLIQKIFPIFTGRVLVGKHLMLTTAWSDKTTFIGAGFRGFSWE